MIQTFEEPSWVSYLASWGVHRVSLHCMSLPVPPGSFIIDKSSEKTKKRANV